MEQLLSLWASSGLAQISGGQFIMLVVGCILLYLAINKQFEPLLLVPIGFGGLMANIPGAGIAFSAVENAIYAGDPIVLQALAEVLKVEFLAGAEHVKTNDPVPLALTSA